MLIEVLNNQSNIKTKQFVANIKQAATLDSLVIAVFKLVLYIGSIILNEIISERAKQSLERSTCPNCGTHLERKEWLPRKMTTLLGQIIWKRLIWRCPKRCKIGQIAPYDQTLGISSSQHVSNEVKKICCLLAVFVPFGIASIIVEVLTGTKVSAKGIWKWVQEAGSKGISKLNEELEELNNGNNPKSNEIESQIAELPMVIGGDGVTVPFRPEEGSAKGKTKWLVVNVGIIARIGKKVTKAGKNVSIIMRRRVIAILDNINVFKNHMKLEGLKEGMSDAKKIVWLSDGGRGFWGVFRELFSNLNNVYGVLDFYHAAQNVYKGAKARFDGRTKKCRVWFKKARKKLLTGKAEHIVKAITRWIKKDELSLEVVKKLNNVKKYLETHADHINYEHYKALGLPIGSGMIESACKWIVQQRFKGVGMRWSKKGFKNLLHLRVAWINGNFDELFCFP